jgi:hypothetical protein
MSNRWFFATLVYELDPLTAPPLRKLLRAELAGRRWNDRFDGHLMPDCTFWIRREAGPDEDVNQLKDRCVRELYDSVQAVCAKHPIKLIRAWVQISGAGTWGLVLPNAPSG